MKEQSMPVPQTLGGLSCQVFNPEGPPEAVAVICHGFGAPGTDLVHLGEHINQAVPEVAQRVKWVFPAAPLSLDDVGMYGGRAWWPLDIEKLNQMIASGGIRDLRGDLPELLPQAREMLMSLIEEVRAETGLPTSKFLIGGFSQGSMLSTDVAFHLDESPGALCIWSGTLLCEEVWKQLAPQRAGLRVVQSHGRQDPILPFFAAELLRDMLEESGLNVDFLAFNGDHTISMPGLTQFVALLQYVLEQ